MVKLQDCSVSFFQSDVGEVAKHLCYQWLGVMPFRISNAVPKELQLKFPVPYLGLYGRPLRIQMRDGGRGDPYPHSPLFDKEKVRGGGGEGSLPLRKKMDRGGQDFLDSPVISPTP